jgi:hypothetical protein
MPGKGCGKQDEDVGGRMRMWMQDEDMAGWLRMWEAE